MNTIDLYNMVLEGRAYSSIGFAFGLLTVILGLATFVLAGIKWDNDISISFKPIICLFIATILSIVSAMYFNFQANLRPTVDDMKVVIPVKIGEDIINSPQVKEAIDKAIKLIPDKI